MKRVFVKFKGGLGNQMFQYAFYKECIARGINAGVCLSVYEKGLDKFVSKPILELNEVFKKITFDDTKILENVISLGYSTFMKIIKDLFHLSNLKFEEKEDSCFDESIYENRYGILEGYWQSEKYFKNVVDDIRKDFTFCIKDTGLEKMADDIKNSRSVSMHIRGGDYLKYKEEYGGICTKKYYEQAIKYIQERIADIKIYVFTSDIAWAKNIVSKKENIVFINEEDFEHYENWYDMYLMSQCEHNIIANSSFSWWGAWLNKNNRKIVIAPWKWSNLAVMPDIYCNGWIKIKGV